MHISKENNHLLTVAFPQLRVGVLLEQMQEEPGNCSQGKKALLSSGGFSLHPCVLPVIGSSVNFLLWFSVADLLLLE